MELNQRSGSEPSALILAIAQRQCRASFATLFNAFVPKLKSYLMRQGCRPEQAEELAQEALLTVWRKAAYFDPARAGASTWIFTIARNLRIDSIRRERRPDDLRDDPTFDILPEPSADALITTQERESQLRQALKDLPDEQARFDRAQRQAQFE